jgi:peptidoglycan/LPS O-acetylase OafA/YrhL
LRWLNNFQRKTSSNNFIPEIDGLRFFAIITVVIFHLNTAIAKELGIELSEAMDQLGGSNNLFSWAWWIVRMDLGVKVFFAISGFVLALPFLKYYLGYSTQKVNLKSYFIRRLTRLEPPFIITLVGFYFIHIWLFGEDPLEWLGHLLAGLLYSHVFIFGTMNPINPVTWSLETEAQFYLLVPIIIGLMFLIRKWNFGIIVLLILSFLSILFRSQFAFSPYLGRSILAFFVNFGMGILFCWIYLKYRVWFNKSIYLYDVVFFISFLGLFYFYKPQYLLFGQLIFNIFILVLLISVFKGKLVNWFYTRSWVYIIGGMCYSIYLIHYAFFHLSIKLTRFLWLDSIGYGANILLQLIVSMPLVLIVSALFFRYFERPFMDKDWLQKFQLRFRK